MSVENWRPVAGFEGQYEVSDWGRVRSLLSNTRFPRLVPKILKPYPRFQPRPGGRLRAMSVTTGRKRPAVHILVLEAFVGPRPHRKFDGCHWDGDPSNNRLENLRWGTKRSNVADSIRHGTKVIPSRRKLSDDAIRCIKAEPKYFGVNKMLARAFAIDLATISRVRTGKVWGRVTP